MKLSLLLLFISLPSLAAESDYWVEYNPKAENKFLVRDNKGSKIPATFECSSDKTTSQIQTKVQSLQNSKLTTKSCSTLEHIAAYGEHLSSLKDPIYFRLSQNKETNMVEISDFTAVDPDRSKISEEDSKEIVVEIKIPSEKKDGSEHAAK
jgi:hypothetical protein